MASSLRRTEWKTYQIRRQPFISARPAPTPLSTHPLGYIFPRQRASYLPSAICQRILTPIPISSLWANPLSFLLQMERLWKFQEQKATHDTHEPYCDVLRLCEQISTRPALSSSEGSMHHLPHDGRGFSSSLVARYLTTHPPHSRSRKYAPLYWISLYCGEHADTDILRNPPGGRIGRGCLSVCRSGQRCSRRRAEVFLTHSKTPTSMLERPRVTLHDLMSRQCSIAPFTPQQCQRRPVHAHATVLSIHSRRAVLANPV